MALLVVTVLVDVGTVPQKQSIGLLLDTMTHDFQVAGVCGEIVIEPE